MGSDTVKLLNTNIRNITLDNLLAELDEGVVVTPNIDHMVKLQKDKCFYEIYENAEYVLLDSRVINFLMFLTGKKLKAVIPGSELFPAYYNYHKENKDIKIFLLGAKPGVAEQAMRNINSAVGREIIVGNYSPSFGFENNIEENGIIISLINKSDANVLAIGVGAPKQEKWVTRYKNELHNVKLYFCIGATIDFEAGNVKRAPKLMRIMALEWLYRLYSEPKRMFKRYFREDLAFFLYFTKQVFGIYKNPHE